MPALLVLGLLVFALSGLIVGTVALRHFARRWNSPVLRALYLIPLAALIIALLFTLFLAVSAAWTTLGAGKKRASRTNPPPAGAVQR